MFEKHPTLAPVGAGILVQPAGVAGLEALGLRSAFEAVSVPVTQLRGHSHRGWRLVDVEYRGAPARGISRPNLMQVLVTRAQALGVELRLGAAVLAVAVDNNNALVCTARDEEVFDIAVVASGSGSPLAQMCGLAAPASLYPWGALNASFLVSRWDGFEALQQRFIGPRKMFGLMPTGRIGDQLELSLFWSLPARDYAAWQQGGLAAWKDELLQLWPESACVVEQIHAHRQLSFATYRHAWPEQLARGPLCLVGDAAHAMSPQLGLGTTLAVGDALALANCLEGRDVSAELQRYHQRRLAHIRRFQWLSRALTPCFQADLPAWWRDTLFAVGVHTPGVRWLMRRSLEG